MSPIYVCLACDDNYVQLASVSIESLLRTNSSAEELEIFLLDGGISEANKNVLINQVHFYHREIEFIDVKEDLTRLEKLGAATQGSYKSYASYSRFFGVSRLPAYVDKLLYVDCDTCFCGDLQGVFDLDMDEYWIGAVVDILSSSHKNYIDFKKEDFYFNAGVLLFNCNKWNECHVLDKIENQIINEGAVYSFHDQDIINIVCKNHIYKLPPQYMTFLPEYTWGIKEILKLSDIDPVAYYNNDEIEYAANYPVIIHYVESIFGRPWYQGCKSKYFLPWIENLKSSPFFKTFRYTEKKKSLSHRLLEWSYYFLPRSLFVKIHKVRKNKVLKEREKSYEEK